MVRIERNSTDTNTQLQINSSTEAKTYLSTVMTVISFFGRYFFVTAWTKYLSISIEMNLKRKNTQDKLRRLDFVDENHEIMGSL